MDNKNRIRIFCGFKVSKKIITFNLIKILLVLIKKEKSHWMNPKIQIAEKTI